jgi:hypothetical protein
MPQRPSSPTPLLWAHKLGLEHQHVLEKIKVIESADKQRESRMVETEVSNKKTQETVAGWNDLVVRVQLLEEDDSDQKMRFETLDRDRNDRIETHGGRLDAQEAKLRNLEAKYRQLDDVLEQLNEDNARLVMAIQKLEETVSNLEIATTRKDDISRNEIKALQARIKILEAEDQGRTVSKQQLAASNTKSQLEAERRKVLEGENQKLVTENTRLQRGKDRRVNQRGAQLSAGSSKLSHPTPGAPQYSIVAARNCPLVKPQRYRS